MDTIIDPLADYGVALRYDALPPEVVHQCKRRIIDTLGCALGAWHEEPCRIARTLALGATAARGARVIGTNHRSTPELAAFAGSVMGRFLDGNDTFPGGGGHPSDMLGALFAAADAVKADGRALFTALVLGYEVYHNLFQATRLREKGMDNVFYTAVGGAAGAGKILGLDRDRLAHALTLAVTPNIALEVTRRGKLSMWKGAAAGNAARNGVFAALLAENGMTGPDRVVDDERGFSGLAGKFSLGELGGNGRPYRITQSSLKFYLSEYHSQSPIWVALQLASQVKPEDIERVTVHTQWFTWFEIGSEPAKWHPTTRETADHSLPWIVAAVLLDGRFSDEIFSEARLRDMRIHALADKIAVKEDPEFTRRFPEEVHCRIEIDTRGQGRKVASVEYPRGHYNNPMTDAEVEAKFRDTAQRVLSPARAQRLLDLLWRIDEARDLDDLYAAARVE